MMIPTVVLTAAAAVVVSAALTNWKRQNRDDVLVRKDAAEVTANNLKVAAKKVENSAARVEVALKPLMAVQWNIARSDSRRGKWREGVEAFTTST